MRLMLGFSDVDPVLLVNVDEAEYNNCKSAFRFYVVNGAWHGKFINGKVYPIRINAGDEYTESEPTNVRPVRILSEDQDRLFGYYRSVFYNWNNPNYASEQKEAKSRLREMMGNDIAF